MKDLVEYIVKSLVTKPEGVSVEETNSEEGVNLLLKVDPEDMGLVIGKAGQTIKAIRRLVLIRAMADNIRVNLELNDPENGRRSEDKEEPHPSTSSEHGELEGTEELKVEDKENSENKENPEK